MRRADVNILRALLIKRGVDLPILLVFAGVLGGLIAFGVVSLFIGPVVLQIMKALGYDSPSRMSSGQRRAGARQESEIVVGGLFAIANLSA
jgi:predicted PurR-regulated permease PerM